MPESVLIQDVEEECVLLNLEIGTYFGLDEVGAQMWKELTSQQSIRDAFNNLLDVYNVESTRLKTDLTEFIEHLKKRGLVTLEKSSNSTK